MSEPTLILFKELNLDKSLDVFRMRTFGTGNTLRWELL